MGDSPLFRVGDDVELWRMLLNFTALALAVTAFESALQALERRLERYSKYRQMITKVYRELMILGILGLAIKTLKEAGAIDESSPETVAFVSADLTLFFLTIALICQAIGIFLQLRLKNKHMDTLELLSSDELYAVAVAHECKRRAKPALARIWCAGQYDSAVQARILRSLFLRTHALPEIFPFAKYLREAQDQQIEHMIDIELSTWLLVFAVAWAINASISTLGGSALFATMSSDSRHDSNLEDSDDAAVGSSTKALLADARSHYALAVVFATFAYSLLLLHIVAVRVLERYVRALLQRAGVQSKSQLLARLKQVAIDEAALLATEVTAVAIARMEDVLEAQQVRQYHRRHRLAQHDMGFQLLATAYRKLRLLCCARSDSSHTAVQPNDAELDASGDEAMHILGFPRKLWHFGVMLLLILNGLYTAMFVQMMMYHLPAFVRALGFVSTLLLPLPLVLNWVVQPQLVRKFILISSLAKVHVRTLSSVVTDFAEAVALQNSFVAELQQCLERSGTPICELERHFRDRDPRATGWIDVEEMRQVLGRVVGFHMSFFKFNAVVRLLFTLQRLQIDYRKVVTLVQLASSRGDDDDDCSAISVSGGVGGGAALGRDGSVCVVSVDGALLQDGLLRPSKVTRQMLMNRSAPSIGPSAAASAAVVASHAPLPLPHTHFAASFVSASSLDSSIAMLGASPGPAQQQRLAPQNLRPSEHPSFQQQPHHHFDAVVLSTSTLGSRAFDAIAAARGRQTGEAGADTSTPTSQYQHI